MYNDITQNFYNIRQNNIDYYKKLELNRQNENFQKEINKNSDYFNDNNIDQRPIYLISLGLFYGLLKIIGYFWN